MLLVGKLKRFKLALLVATLVLVSFCQAASAKQVPAYDCSVQTDLDPAECNALVAIYTSTNDLVTPNGWINQTGWLIAANPCTWFGVTCSAGQLSSLSLPINNLTGTLPSEIGIFSNLLTLDFSGNFLTGPLNPEFGGLVSLITLNLSANAFSGKLPSTLGNLSALETLDLGNNSFDRKLPTTFANLKNLNYIDTTGNSLCIPDNTALKVWYNDPNLVKIDTLPNCDLPPTPTISLTPTETMVPITLTPTQIPLPTLTHTATSTATSTSTPTMLGPFQTLTMLAEWETMIATALWTNPPTENPSASSAAPTRQTEIPDGEQAEDGSDLTEETLSSETPGSPAVANGSFSPYWWGLLIVALGLISTGIILELKRR